MKFHYCEKCKEDFHRMSLGYSPKPGNCGNWECRLYNILNLIVGAAVLIPILIILVPLLMFLLITNKIPLHDL